MSVQLKSEIKRVGCQVLREGLLLPVGLSFLASGFNRRGAEIAQLTLYSRMRKKIEKKFATYVNQSGERVDKLFAASKLDRCKTVWCLWFQGFENAPAIVSKCVQSVKENLPDYEIVFLTERNLYEYVTLPNNITDKYNRGLISKTHLSDIIRLFLLTEHGGIWMDSTVFLTDRPKEYQLESPLFVFQTLSPGSSGQAIPVSSWYIETCEPSRILLLARELLLEYWNRYNRLIDYYLVHYFICIAAERYPEEWSRIPPVSNEAPQLLLSSLLLPFNEDRWGFIKSQSAIHKTTYKISDKELKHDPPLTFLNSILSGEVGFFGSKETGSQQDCQ